ncbi:hypothetical protein SCACP_25870 [Sporomusa carbonis]|uniref:RNA polymerase subunit sigma-70 n=1 Tax=Sporomusa carbonis TaxID=3076075 RepID=UPI003A695AC0
MTETQAEQIREFRLKGIGYKAIASILDLSRDVVRNYCKDQGLEGYGPVVAVNKQEQMQQGSLCRCCSQTIRQPGMGRKRIFCSDQCRRQWWAAHPEDSRKKETAIYKKTCVYCGRQFTVYASKNRKYCSHECYVHDRFWREEEGREPYLSPARREEAKHE